MDKFFLIYRSDFVTTWTCGDGCCSESEEVMRMEDICGIIDNEESAKAFCAQRGYSYYPMPLIKGY